MADKTEFLQAIDDAILDADSLERFINGSDGETVLTRLSAEYPTLQKALKELFENGGIAARFKTLSELQASPLVDGAYALVADDIDDKNGIYIKEGGAWVKSSYNPLDNAKAYADANPLFKPAQISAGSDLNLLDAGIYYNYAADAQDILNMPPLTSSFKVGLVEVIRRGASAYQRFYHYNTLEQWERAGNGSSSNLQYGAWTKVIKQSDIDATTTLLSASLASKPDLNLFKNVNLTSADASIYQATVADESGYPTLMMDTDKLSSVFYDSTLDDKYFKVGATVVFSTQVFSDEIGTSGGDITIQALSSAGSALATSTTSRNSTANTWETISTSLVLPSGTAKVRTRFIRRLGNTVVKFRNPVLSSDTIYGRMILPSSSGNDGSVNVANIVYVAKTGDDTNQGGQSDPFKTIQKAVDAIALGGGEVRVLDSEDYREVVTIDSPSHVKISAAKNERVNIFGSNRLEVTKTAGFNKVYQAPLASKPVGMGGNRGKPAIFEWGTKSKPIDESERHYLHHGLTHRLPYTEMHEVETKAELDTTEGNGKWFWESGIIYLSATDGGDATAKRYEARARPVITHTNGTIELVRVTSWFSSAQGMDFKGISTKRSGCIVYGAYKDGFSDNANITHSHRDRAGGCGNDGFNCTVTTYATTAEISDRIEQLYYDPYGHDNGDDGISCHYRSDSTIYGGLFEYNTKADVVHVTGANCVCYNTVARGATNGFYAASEPNNDSERVSTVFRCVGTISTGNDYAYRTANNAILNCINTKAINPNTWGYSQNGDGVINATDCGYAGDSSKTKVGNVVAINTSTID